MLRLCDTQRSGYVCVLLLPSANLQASQSVYGPVTVTWRCRSPGRVIVSVRVEEMPFILSAIAYAYQKELVDWLQVSLHCLSMEADLQSLHLPLQVNIKQAELCHIFDAV